MTLSGKTFSGKKAEDPPAHAGGSSALWTLAQEVTKPEARNVGAAKGSSIQ